MGASRSHGDYLDICASLCRICQILSSKALIIPNPRPILAKQQVMLAPRLFLRYAAPCKWRQIGIGSGDAENSFDLSLG
jgi:hypothetical protein